MLDYLDIAEGGGNMAAWQFDFYLIPKINVLKIFNELPEVLDDYLPYDGKRELKEISEYPNYWNGYEINEEIHDFFSLQLDAIESWDDEAKMYGESNGNKVEVWEDDILCRIDAREVNMKLLYRILEFAKAKSWVVVLKENGKVLEPNIFSLANYFRMSFSFKFCKEPEKTLKEMKKKPSFSVSRNLGSLGEED